MLSPGNRQLDAEFQRVGVDFAALAAHVHDTMVRHCADHPEECPDGVPPPNPGELTMVLESDDLAEVLAILRALPTGAGTGAYIAAVEARTQGLHGPPNHGL